MYRIPTHWNVKRKPRVSIQEQKTNITFDVPFKHQFDWDILFADCIDIGDNRILLVGAPLYELESIIKFSDGSKVLNHTFYNLDRVCITIVDGSADTIYCNDLEIKVSQPSTMFSGLGCMVNMQKNEPLDWIADWVLFHNKEHGIRGFCLYNNNSDQYTTQDIKDRIDSLNLDIVVEYVDWEMPNGPETSGWNSDYGKYIMFEHFKYKYGWCAEYVLNHDIDELFLCKNGINSTINYMKAHDIAALIYGNINIDPYNNELNANAFDLSINDRRCYNYYSYTDQINNYDLYGKKSITKWLLLPSKTMECQWKIHTVDGQIGKGEVKKANRSIYFAHFMSMRSNNRSTCSRDVSEATSSERIVDDYLRDRMAVIFNQSVIK